MKTPPWVNNFIRYDIKNDEYVAWDETQANEIGRSYSKKIVIDLILSHAKSLEEEQYYVD